MWLTVWCDFIGRIIIFFFPASCLWPAHAGKLSSVDDNSNGTNWNKFWGRLKANSFKRNVTCCTLCLHQGLSSLFIIYRGVSVNHVHTTMWSCARWRWLTEVNKLPPKNYISNLKPLRTYINTTEDSIQTSTYIILTYRFSWLYFDVHHCHGLKKVKPRSNLWYNVMTVVIIVNKSTLRSLPGKDKRKTIYGCGWK